MSAIHHVSIDGTSYEIEDSVARGTTLISTLTAGQTSLAFTNAAITSSASYDVYTSIDKVPYQTLTIEGTTATLTFAEQSQDMSVQLLIH